MADINLPVQGEEPWDAKLNAALDAINTEVGVTTQTITTGRLSEANILSIISSAAPSSFLSYSSLAAAEEAYGNGAFQEGTLVLIDVNA